jgi:hypothetical protein
MRTRLSLTVLLSALALTIGVARLTAVSPIADAAMRGDGAGVRTLIAQGADVNAPQGDGMTALHWTALNGDLTTVSALLAAGAKTELVTRVGSYTPLHLASSRGHGAVVAKLLDSGSNAKALTATGVQAIHLAAQAGNPDAVKALLDHGADVNVRDDTHGRTPLVFAASEDRVAVMKVLIAKGANLGQTTNVIDYQQRSAADTASGRRAIAIAAPPGMPIGNAAGGVKAANAARGGWMGSRWRGGRWGGRCASRRRRSRRRTRGSAVRSERSGHSVPRRGRRRGARPLGHPADRTSGRIHGAALRGA